MEAAPTWRPYGVLLPDGMQGQYGGPPPDSTRAASVSPLEAQLQRGRTRHPVPVWRQASRGYGVLPPDGAHAAPVTHMEGELQTICTLRQPPAARVLYYSASIAIANNVGTGANLL